MRDGKKTVLVPAYFGSFRCISSACEDNCCRGGWRINIDEETYKKYRRMKDGIFKTELEKYIKRNRSVSSFENYAKIKIDREGNCPFHTDDGKCGLQLELGEEYLSNVCMTYPRQTNIVNGRYEKSMSPSCIEAARLMLQNPQGIDFHEIEEDRHARDIIHIRIDEADVRRVGKLDRYVWDMRFFTIMLLQNRSYSLAERLILLGMLCSRMDNAVKEGKSQSIPQILHTFKSLMDDVEATRRDMKDIPVQDAVQVKLIKELTDERFYMVIKNKRYLQCYTEMMAGLGYIKGAEVEAVPAKYRFLHNEHYVPVMEEKGYILENYLVNTVFKECFPYHTSLSVYEVYCLLVARYAMVKLNLIGMSGFHKTLDDTLIIKLLQSFSHQIDHNPSYMNRMVDLMKANGLTTMAYMAILIKN